MGTFLLYLFGLIVVGGLLFLIASLVFGRGEELAPMPREYTPLELPQDRPVTGADLRRVRLPVVFRGYRMTEVDWLVDELSAALDERDREIARLHAARAAGVRPMPEETLADGRRPTTRRAGADDDV